MLVEINQLHSLKYPEDLSVEDRTKVAYRLNILRRIEPFEPSLRLARHLRRGHVERGEADPFDSAVDLIDRSAPAENCRGAEETTKCARYGLFKIFTRRVLGKFTEKRA